MTAINFLPTPATPAERPAPLEPTRPDFGRAARTARGSGDRVRDISQDDDTRTTDPTTEPARDDFQGLLALLANSDSGMRQHLLAQMPPEGAALLDRLLNGGGTVQQASTSSTDAVDAVRYGMLTTKSTSATIDAPDTRTAANVLVANAAREALRSGILSTGDESSDAVNGLGSIARQTAPGRSDTTLVAALSARGGSSVEELLAVGDTRNAGLKRALDMLLTRAGAQGAEGITTDDPALGSSASLLSTLAASAHLAALEAAHAKSAADVSTPVKDPTSLDPNFRAKLEKVIARMKSEYGHTVELVETTRSPERQDHLFEQGRSRPGAIVTWTRDSAHITGEAADLLVDGQWSGGGEGYEHLQKIAREEGLRTLGARDPGHVELPREARNAFVANRLNLTDATRTQPIVRVAGSTLGDASNGSTGVAQVATVANVAAVAGVAQAGSGSRSYEAMNATPDVDPATVRVPEVKLDPATARNGNGAGTQDNNSRAASQRTSNEQSSTRRESRDDSNDPASAAPYAAPVQQHGISADRAARHVGAAGSTTFDRVMHAEQVRDSAPARPVNELTLDVENADGGSDRITIGMRGTTVDTHIATDADSADRLRMRTGELQDALGRHGLDADTVQISARGRQETSEVVRSIGGAAERDAVRAGAAQQSQNGDGTLSHNQRERSSATRDWQDKQQDARREREEQREQEARQRRNPFTLENK